ncbi:MAG: Gfo/Idh/MocA family protein [Pirellulaceae bacterium]
MAVRFAFAGFRHPHLFDMYDRCRKHAAIEVVASCEEDAATRAQLQRDQRADITHTSFDRMLAEVDCDVIAVGDYYERRGPLILAALEAGRHVITDKPPCIRLEELDRIEQLVQARQRVVGCMLDMRDLPVYLGLRDAIRENRIGKIQAVSFEGQHPLMYGRRPAWYFEPGKHGGVFNDIAIHALDFLPWATGLAIESITAARGWNATVPQHPEFQQCGQALLVLQGGAGVTCDVSYLTPDSFAYKFPHYWRFTFWGSDGVLEAAVNSPHVTLFRNGDTAPQELPLPPGRPGAYLDSFLQEIQGKRQDLHLSSSDGLRAARLALLLQQAADQQQHRVAVHSHSP